MIKVVYCAHYWYENKSANIGPIKLTKEFSDKEHEDFTKECLLLKTENRLIRCSVRYDYITDDWYRIMNEKLVIDYDRNRLIQENNV